VEQVVFNLGSLVLLQTRKNYCFLEIEIDKKEDSHKNRDGYYTFGIYTFVTFLLRKHLI